MRMKTTFLFFLAVVMLLASCQKEVNFQDEQTSGGGGGTGNNNKSIIGDWIFAGMVGDTKSTVVFTDMGIQLKGVTTSLYYTKNNKGTVKITSSQFLFTGVGYDIDTTMHVKTYIDNVLLDDSDMPLVASTPPTDTKYDYVKNNADSLTLAGTVMSVSDPFSGGGPSGPSGGKISWSSDTLLITVKSHINTPISQGGTTGLLTGDLIGILKLKKK